MMSRMNEAVLDPDIRICDPHHHLWDRADDRYMLGELTQDLTSGHRVEQTVFVECGSGYRPDGPAAMRPVGETEFVVAWGSEVQIAGIVGHADLRTREIDDVLAAHTDAGRGRFRGIRHSSAWDASPKVWRSPADTPRGLLGDSAFRSGIAALGRAEPSSRRGCTTLRSRSSSAWPRPIPGCPSSSTIWEGPWEWGLTKADRPRCSKRGEGRWATWPGAPTWS